MTWRWRGMSYEERFQDRTLKTDTCWLWQGCLNTGGYGQMKDNGKFILVHRYSYERDVGPIPEGLTLDHLCSVRHCVNPTHLEPVTKGENSRRGIVKRGLKSHCVNGHDLSINRRAPRPGVFWCLACNREKQRIYNRLKREKAMGLGE